MVIYNRVGSIKYKIPSESPFFAIDSAKIQRQHMANDYVQLQLRTTEVLSLEIGDWIIVRGCGYYIRTISDITRTGEDVFSYNITFYGAMYELMRYKYRNTAINGRSSQNTFDLTFSLKDFIKLIVYNVMRVEEIDEADINNSPWIFDEDNCPDTSPITMSFDQQNCLTALQNITNEFDVEFLITQEYSTSAKRWQNKIHIGSFGEVVNSKSFAYGMGSGLYQLQETKVDDGTIVNRLYVEGSSENILSGYRGYSTRLQLPRKNIPRTDDSNASRRYSRNQHTIEIDGEKITFKEGYPIGIDSEEKRYIDENILHSTSLDTSRSLRKKEGETSWVSGEYQKSNLIEKYGVIEDSIIIDDVMPSPTFTITDISTSEPRLTFMCNVDFDLSARWANVYSDFYEWCLLKTQIVPTEAEYLACIEFDEGNEFSADDQGTILGWTEYAKEFATGKTIDLFVDWRKKKQSASAPALPNIPIKYRQDVYEQYLIFKELCLSATNSKYLIDGGCVVFINGKLSGIEFQIANATYNSVTKKSTITIRTKEEPETDDIFPSEDDFGAFRFSVGDTFKITNIYLPYKYYEDAEEELWFKAYEKFENIKHVSCQYRLSFDPIFVSENTGVFERILPGDYITITDDRFALYDKKMRITQIECDLINTTSYSINLENVHKAKTRYGFKARKADEALQALSEMRLDEPLYRRNNRTSGSRAVTHILDSNGCLRDIRIADYFISERMVGNEAVTSDKIRKGAVSREKITAKAINSDLLDDGAVVARNIGKNSIVAEKIKAGAISKEKFDSNVSKEFDKINTLQFFRRYVNDGANQDRYYQGEISFKENILRFSSVIVNDSLSKDILGCKNSTWSIVNNDIDFSQYEPEKHYIVYSVLKEDGSCSIDIKDTEDKENIDDSYLKIAEIGENISGKREITMCIGTSHIENGVWKDNKGNVIIDIPNGMIMQKRNDGTFISVKDIDSTIGSSSKPGTILYRTSNLEWQVGDDETEGSLMYRATSLEKDRETHRLKINETIDSIYSANQILLKVQNSFNTVLGKLSKENIITSEEEEKLLLGIESCVFDPLNRNYTCSASLEGIGVPEIIDK